MSVDKLVDSTQLDSDLTSVANAIRTKGGTSASLAFPADFVSAIAAIPSGGGVTAATGEITIASDVGSPGTSENKLFPGLQLSFKPDFLWISLKYDSWMSEDQAASHGANLFIACRKTMIPPYRASGTAETDDNTNDYVYIYSSTSYAGTWVDGQITPNTGYGMAAVNTLVQNPLTYNGAGTWSINDDGTFSYGRGSNTVGVALKANSVYRYFAVKV